MTDESEAKVFARLDEIGTLVAETHATVKLVAQRVEDHEVILDGPADNSTKPGVRIRLDRVERTLRVAWVAVVGIVGLLCNAIAGWWKG